MNPRAVPPPPLKFVTPLFLAVVALSTWRSLNAEDTYHQFPLPLVTLVQPPRLPPISPRPLSEDQQYEIEGLIADLSELDARDGLINFVDRTVFVPVGGYETFLRNSQVFWPIRRLIEIGPDALPFLLRAIDDSTATKIVIQSVPRHGAIFGGIEFNDILDGNPANLQERLLLNLYRERRIFSDDTKEFVAHAVEQYRVKVGDICFEIIGQIVGRRYYCLNGFSNDGVFISSSVHSERIGRIVRQLWTSDDPRQKVFDSLLIDFSTRPLQDWDEKSLDSFDAGNQAQCEAAMRLLFYYLDEAENVVARRAADLRVSDDYVKDTVVNGVRADDFIRAIGWSKSLKVRDALSDVGHRATCELVVDALRGFGVPVSQQ